MGRKKASKPQFIVDHTRDSVGLFEVERIIDDRIYGNVRQYLVKWKDWPSSTNTWEPEINLQLVKNQIANYWQRKQRQKQLQILEKLAKFQLQQRKKKESHSNSNKHKKKQNQMMNQMNEKNGNGQGKGKNLMRYYSNIVGDMFSREQELKKKHGLQGFTAADYNQLAIKRIELRQQTQLNLRRNYGSKDHLVKQVHAIFKEKEQTYCVVVLRNQQQITVKAENAYEYFPALMYNYVTEVLKLMREIMKLEIQQEEKAIKEKAKRDDPQKELNFMFAEVKNREKKQIQIITEQQRQAVNRARIKIIQKNQLEQAERKRVEKAHQFMAEQIESQFSISQGEHASKQNQPSHRGNKLQKNNQKKEYQKSVSAEDIEFDQSQQLRYRSNAQQNNQGQAQQDANKLGSDFNPVQIYYSDQSENNAELIQGRKPSLLTRRQKKENSLNRKKSQSQISNERSRDRGASRPRTTSSERVLRKPTKRRRKD